MKDYNNIPTELKTIPNWVYSSSTKVPFATPDKGVCQIQAKANDASTWGTFEDAVSAANYCGGGIGFECGVEKCGFTGLGRAIADPSASLSG